MGLEVFRISTIENVVAAFLQPVDPILRCHALLTCLLGTPALSVPKPSLGLPIFPDKVSLLDKAFVAHPESFFSNIALGFPPFI